MFERKQGKNISMGLLEFEWLIMFSPFQKSKSQILFEEIILLQKQTKYPSAMTSKWKSLLDLYKDPKDEENKPYSLADDLQM